MKKLRTLLMLILVTCLFSVFAIQVNAASYSGTGKSNVKWSSAGTLKKK